MFFMAKSALCIGVVAVLASGAIGGEGVRATIESGSREAATRLGVACAASQACLGLGGRIATAAIGRQAVTVPDLVGQAGAAQVVEALAGAVPPIASSPRPEVGHPPHLAERRPRRAATARN